MQWIDLLCVTIFSTFFSSVEGATQCERGALEPDVIDRFLKQINAVRSEVVQGITLKFNDDERTLPSGKTMNRIYWSCDLEKAVLDAYSGKCDKNPTAPSGKSFIGIDLLSCNKSDDIDRSSLFLEGGIYRYWLNDSKEVKTMGDTSADLFNPKTTQIGCAYYDRCDDGRYGQGLCLFYCFTNQAPLKKGDVVYEVGGGGCEGCSTGVCDPVSKLCEMADYPKGPNTKCPNVRMTDELRTIYVYMHNYYRVLLANGEVARKGGNYFPKGANIIKLEVNCDLEAGAFAYASTCPHAVSFEGQREGVAEHYHRVSVADAAYRDAFLSAVANWWIVVRYYPGPGVEEVTFRANHVGTPIETFTQMAWATTSQLGCSVVKCSSDYVIICRYSPKGNIVEQKLYTPGPPCSMCSKGCYKDKGLCLA